MSGPMTGRSGWRLALRTVAGVVGLAAVTGCQDQPAPPTTVVINTPPADAGLSVLLTVMIAVALIAVLAAVVGAWGWAAERRARRDSERARRVAEDAVLAVTGQPVKRVRLELIQRGPLPGRWPVEEQRAAIDGRPQP